MGKAKPFDFPKREVWAAFKRVKANQGAAGVDAQSIAEFEVDLSNNLYKLWNRLSSGLLALRLGARHRRQRLLRQYRLGAVAQGGPSSYELPVGAALHRALAEGAGADGGRQRRAAHSGNAAGWGHQPAPCKPVPALCVRCVDVAKLSAHS